jgi:hypothetical protein
MSLIGSSRTWRARLADVRFRGQSGKRLLDLSLTAFDPEAAVSRVEISQRSSLLP